MLLNFTKKPEHTCSRSKQQLLSQIKESKRCLELAYSNFDNMTEPDLIDCSIYELKAAQARYEYLLSCAKEYNISCLYDQIIS